MKKIFLLREYMDKYSTPGVFVEEVKNLSLSIASGETAIPVIAASTEDFTLLEAGAGIDYFEVNSWLDVTARAGGNASAVRVAMAKVEAGNPASGREIDAVTAAGETYIAFVATRQLGQAGWAETVENAKSFAKAAATEAAEKYSVKTVVEIVSAAKSHPWSLKNYMVGDADIVTFISTTLSSELTAGKAFASPVYIARNVVAAVERQSLKTAKNDTVEEGEKRSELAKLEAEIHKFLSPFAEAQTMSVLDSAKFLMQKYINAFNQSIGLNAATEDGIADLKKTMLGQSLEAFFVNGGGRAYVCKADSVGTAVGLLSDVTLLVEAGANLNKQVVARVCTEKSGIFGVLDARNVPPSSDVTSVLPTDIGENDNVAFYYPWFKSASQHDTAPSAVMAGIYAKVDAERGVWKAPANVAVQGVVPKYVVTDNQQAKLNDHTTPINVIRSFGAGTPLVWGARTGKKASPFRYIPVRRLFNAMERDIKKAMKQAVFEPNTSATWEKVRSAIDNYLHEIWRQGGLMGEKPGDAYRISIGEGVTMTATQIQQGQMIAEVAVAPTRPAEFVVLRFSEKMQSI
ncbi:phage tail sheath family protein [Robbsia andropogonis]|uniref:phage tail sheath family protein n=1 Tax=Robbsia andropogonis TaxID=28092 RepID=UPI00209C7D51|nr:phage tail sheath C-terminal domain-containing protein [Robbsia andropogonis]MCP1117754.1 phage tail sheath subtilisin-like domain-containing protein [Robbsia andropogonis]MCP1127219.1 phage tail sheath subtilisin-like domain-containing protein [Robbsia andropogonis]